MRSQLCEKPTPKLDKLANAQAYDAQLLKLAKVLHAGDDVEVGLPTYWACHHISVFSGPFQNPGRQQRFPDYS